MKARWFLVLCGFILAATAYAQLLQQNFDSVQTPSLPSNWSGTGLWKTVHEDDFTAAEKNPIKPFPSRFIALYYGNVTGGRGTYNTGDKTQGCVRTNDITTGFSPGDWIRVSFKYFRVVEDYAKGGYDKTLAYVVFMSGSQYLHPETGEPVATEASARLVIFYKDSKDPPSTAWESFVSDPFKAPPNANKMYVGFEFDSVDKYYNDYLGWLIDDLTVEKVPGPVTITTTSLPVGQVGQPYEAQLQATGGTGSYTWSAYGLPDPRISGLEFDAGGFLRGIPLQAGRWDVTFQVRDSAGARDTKTLTLEILPAGGALIPILEQCWEEGLGNWTATGLWHCTTSVQGVDLTNRNGVAYYGKDDATNPNYDTGARTSGFLTSPAIDVSEYAGAKVRVVFDYWRKVEYYTKAPYDKTWVEITFDGTDWITIWSKDSRDVSEATWTRAEVMTDIEVPARGADLQIRFCFDSVDNVANKFVGWLIDCVKVYLVAPQALGLEILTRCEDIPPATKGQAYSLTLRARGGTPPYTWEVSGLPAGLTLDRYLGKISGTPTESGTFRLLITVTDSARNQATKECTLAVVEVFPPLFVDDFSADIAVNWNITGLWHRSNNVKGVDLTNRGGVAYYGKDDATAPNYDTGARTTGALETKDGKISIPTGVTAVKVSFDYWREVESYNGPYDQTYVEILFKVGTSWNTYRVWYLDSSTPSEKTWKTVVLGPYLVPTNASEMKIRFVFDSVDKYNNRYVGWLIDNVKVERAPTGSPLSILSVPEVKPREISFFNVPNPVRDVHTTTFVVRGVEAERIRVEVYDLTGKLVWKGEALGNELTWHTEDLTGLPLANGVYLYKVYVKVGEAWIVSDVKKLVILR